MFLSSLVKCKKSWISQMVLPLYRPAPSQTCESEVCLMALTWLLCSCGALRKVWTAGCRWRRDKTWLRCSTDPPWLRISSGGLSSARLARTCQDAAKTQREISEDRESINTINRYKSQSRLGKSCDYHAHLVSEAWFCDHRILWNM